MPTLKLTRLKIFSFIGLFIVFFVFFLMVWLFIKLYYAYIISYLSAKIVCFLRGFSIKHFLIQGDDILLVVSRPVITVKGYADLDINLQTKVSNFTFNVPLTLALLCSIRSILRFSWRVFFEAFLLLLIIHFLFMFLFVDTYLISFLNKNVFNIFQVIEEYLWAFVDNLLIRFEPFLISIYVLIREKILFTPVKSR